jgi:hypothetical protein
MRHDKRVADMTPEEHEAEKARARKNSRERRADPKKREKENSRRRGKKSKRPEELRAREIFVRQPDEELRQLEDFPGYWASNLGRLVSAPKPGNLNHKEWIVLQPATDGSERLSTNLYCGCDMFRVRVHDIVGRAFNEVDDTPSKQWCHRPDPDFTNNRADNLVWDTAQKNVWEDELVKNPNWLQDCFISKLKGHLKKPFFVQILINGKQQHVGGYYATIEEARMVRDWLCNKHGIELPTGEFKPWQPKPANPLALHTLAAWWI